MRLRHGLEGRWGAESELHELIYSVGYVITKRKTCTSTMRATLHARANSLTGLAFSNLLLHLRSAVALGFDDVYWVRVHGVWSLQTFFPVSSEVPQVPAGHVVQHLD